MQAIGADGSARKRSVIARNAITAIARRRLYHAVFAAIADVVARIAARFVKDSAAAPDARICARGGGGGRRRN
ncbi:MAG TPA: hypothetical protein VGO62_18095, partial [Myxococcota bacterium]